MSIRILVFLWLFFIQIWAGAQSVKLSFQPYFGTEKVMLSDTVPSIFGPQNLKIETLRFYLSNFQLLKNGKVVFEEKNSFHLLDASDEKSLQLSLQTKDNLDFNTLKFDLGIDSLTNVSGAIGGDLDPTKGMYWTWQSGYINFKLEGTSQLCKTRNSEYQFHLGGYQQPNYGLQTLEFAVRNSKAVNISLDLKAIFDQIDLTKTNHIMSPNQEAVLLSKIVAQAFSIQP